MTTCSPPGGSEPFRSTFPVPLWLSGSWLKSVPGKRTWDAPGSSPTHVIPDLRPGIDLGFSALEISTPVRVLSIGEITYTRPDGSTSAEEFGDADLEALPIRRGDLSIDLIEETRFRVGFPTVESSRIEDGEMTVIKVTFTCPVLRAATRFFRQGASPTPPRACRRS